MSITKKTKMNTTEGKGFMIIWGSADLVDVLTACAERALDTQNSNCYAHINEAISRLDQRRKDDVKNEEEKEEGSE